MPFTSEVRCGEEGSFEGRALWKMMLLQLNLQPRACLEARTTEHHVIGSVEAISARGTAPSSGAVAKPVGFVTPLL